MVKWRRPQGNFFVLFWHLYERRSLTREPGLVISMPSSASLSTRHSTSRVCRPVCGSSMLAAISFVRSGSKIAKGGHYPLMISSSISVLSRHWRKHGKLLINILPTVTLTLTTLYSHWATHNELPLTVASHRFSNSCAFCSAGVMTCSLSDASKLV